MPLICFFFFNNTATTEIYTLSLHDALPIYGGVGDGGERTARDGQRRSGDARRAREIRPPQDRKSTRLNSSHSSISYAVFCLKKKKAAEHLLACRRVAHHQVVTYPNARCRLE